jgi:hypothetical protein
MSEMPPLPETLEECHRVLTTIWQMSQRTHLFLGDIRWNEGHWFYRDRSNGKLFLVAGCFRPGIPIALVGWESGVTMIGVLGEEDPIERNHAQGQEVLTVYDRMGDFESVAERMQGRRLS